MKLQAKMTHIRALTMKGIPPEAWENLAKMVESWKQQDLSTDSRLIPRTGQLWRSIQAKETLGRGKNAGIRTWKITPKGTRTTDWRNVRKRKLTAADQKDSRVSFKDSGGKLQKFKDGVAVQKRLRNQDLMYYQVREQGVKFMSLSVRQQKLLRETARKLLTAAIKSGRVRVAVDGSIKVV